MMPSAWLYGIILDCSEIYRASDECLKYLDPQDGDVLALLVAAKTISDKLTRALDMVIMIMTVKPPSAVDTPTKPHTVPMPLMRHLMPALNM